MCVPHRHKLLVLISFLGAISCIFIVLDVQQLQKTNYVGQNFIARPLDLRAYPIATEMDERIVDKVLEKAFETVNNAIVAVSSTPKSKTLPTIYIITATYKRPEQVPDLVRLAQTLMHVQSILWLVVEDAQELNPHVTELLQRSGIKFLHLLAPMPEEHRLKKVKPRGVSNRNKGLQWIKENVWDTSGIIYFADDDNTYDLQLFPEIRSVKKIGMWPVGLLTSYGMSSPIVVNGKVTGFYDGWVAKRKFPVDMAGFAVSVSMILKGNVSMPFRPGYEEDGFLRSLNVTMTDIEPKADNCSRIFVWHTQTRKNRPPKEPNITQYSETNIWKLYQQII